VGEVGYKRVWVAMGQMKDRYSLAGSPPRSWPCSYTLWSRCSSGCSPPRSSSARTTNSGS